MLQQTLHFIRIFFVWLHSILFWWVRTKVVLAQQLKDELQNNDTPPVVYVLSLQSYIDFLVLYHHCLQYNLPVPKLSIKDLMKHKTSPGASFIYLGKAGLFAPTKTHQPPGPLQALCEHLHQYKNRNVLLIPVSIIWGRNPGSEERSLFKLLFPDDEHAGILQKLFIVLAQGRNTLIHFGQPINLRQQVDLGPNTEQVARKLRRVLRVHFRTQRIIALGPKTYDRNRIINSLFQSPAIQKAIDYESQKTGTPRARVEKKAIAYLKEIANAQTPSIVRFFDIFLSYLWNRIYDGIIVKGQEPLRELAEKKVELIYVPSHRSHLDYLIMPYQLYHFGMTVPLIAAGINLNFWPIGPLLRRAAAFFIRRSFRGNYLYTMVFNEYLRFILTKGHALCFFPEGGRSRTGRLRKPMTGMLSMIVSSYLKGIEKEIYFIPVFITYDRVPEIKSYIKELRGRGKTRENIQQFLKARKILRTYFGRAYISFGPGISLREFLTKYVPELNKENNFNIEEEKPRWFTQSVSQLALKINESINAQAIVTPVGLVATCLLSVPQRAMTEKDLKLLLITVIKLLDELPKQLNISIDQRDPDVIIHHALKVMPINRHEFPDNEYVIYANEEDAVAMSYYRNNILHLFCLPALVASFFEYNDEIKLTSIVNGCDFFYSLLKEELFLPWSQEEIPAIVSHIISIFIDLKLIISNAENSDTLQRCQIGSEEFNQLKIIGRCLGVILDRYAISSAALLNFPINQSFNRREFEKLITQLVQKTSLLNGLTDPEFYDPTLLNRYVDLLVKQGYLKCSDDEQLRVLPSINALAKNSFALLSPDVRRNLLRINLGNIQNGSIKER